MNSAILAILGAIVLCFAFVGLVFGGMLAFDATTVYFSRLNMRSVLSMMFLAVLVLIGVALLALVILR